MQKKWGILVVVAALAGCGDDDDVGDSQERTADIDGTEGFEQLDGEANVRWSEGTTGFIATIELRGDEEGQVRPWHVHFGTCETGGAIVGPPGDYPPLEIGQAGNGLVTATVDERLDRNEDYHVNVHLSDTELDTIIACGDLEDDDFVIDL